MIDVDNAAWPEGMKVVRAIQRAGQYPIRRLEWSPDGRTLAVASSAGTIELIDIETGSHKHLLKGHRAGIYRLSFAPDGHRLATGALDNTVALWDANQGNLVQDFATVCTSPVAWSPDGLILATTSPDYVVRLWDPVSLEQAPPIWLYHGVYDLAWSPDSTLLACGSQPSSVIEISSRAETTIETKGGTRCAWSPHSPPRWLAIAGVNHTVRIWEAATGNVTVLEAHRDVIVDVAFSHDGRLLASSARGETCLWGCGEWDLRARFAGTSGGSLAFHPSRPWLALPSDDDHGIIQVVELDVAALLTEIAVNSLKYTTAKIVLVGDSGVGKTGLGWRLAHGEFKEHASTHGQQFWPWTALETTRSDGAQCEAILWDLAGQPDYRLIHALFLDDADLAVVLFDPTRADDPLHGVEFWLGQFTAAKEESSGTPAILVAARSDRGAPTLTPDELNAFCAQLGVRAFVMTSAKTGEGIDELVDHIKSLITWDQKIATVTTHVFRRLKNHILTLKADPERVRTVVEIEELRRMVQSLDSDWEFSDAELMTAVGHLENHGYVTRLRTSGGDIRILLAPELLNNLAASIVLEARRNPKGLGSLDEKQLLEGGYRFSDLDGLEARERSVLLDCAALLFLRHNVCFRETDPLTSHSYLIFPDLINLKKPAAKETEHIEEGVSYRVTGSVENVYASLVVLLGYTQTFARTDQWHNQARYVVGDGLICGFRLETGGENELTFVLHFGFSPQKWQAEKEFAKRRSPYLTDDQTNPAFPIQIRTLFQSLCEAFLARRNLTVERYEPVRCSEGHLLDSGLVRKLTRQNKEATFCHECGAKLRLGSVEIIQLERLEAGQVALQRRTAEKRTRFEEAVFRLQLYTKEAAILGPECFISYAWGNPTHERWVERSLATDLQKAGLRVLLDRWDNARVGATVSRFVERIAAVDRVLVVGTPLYRQKYDAREAMGRYIVAAEGDLIGRRLLTRPDGGESALPLLLEGSEEESFPPLLQGKVYADFRAAEDYFATMFDVILSLYGVEYTDTAVADLREWLRES